MVHFLLRVTANKCIDKRVACCVCLLVTSVGRWVECWEGVGRLIRRVYRHEHEVETFAVGFGLHSVARAVGNDLPIRFYHLVNECERTT